MQKLMGLKEAAEYYRSMPDSSIETKKFEYAAAMLTAMLMGLGSSKGALTDIENFIQDIQKNYSEKQALEITSGLALAIAATIQKTWDDEDKEKRKANLWS
jgi:hypothetical protein